MAGDVGVNPAPNTIFGSSRSKTLTTSAVGDVGVNPTPNAMLGRLLVRRVVIRDRSIVLITSGCFEK